MSHSEPHPLAGQTVKLELAAEGPNLANGDLYQIEDYWDRISGGSWMFAAGNPAAMLYGMRSGIGNLPVDDEVVYGKDEFGLGHIVHVSELIEPTETEKPA